MVQTYERVVPLRIERGTADTHSKAKDLLEGLVVRTRMGLDKPD